MAAPLALALPLAVLTPAAWADARASRRLHRQAGPIARLATLRPAAGSQPQLKSSRKRRWSLARRGALRGGRRALAVVQPPMPRCHRAPAASVDRESRFPPALAG